MKKILFTVLFIILATDLATAYNPPKGMADVVGRNLNAKPNDWLERRGYGHLGIYDSRSNKKKVLDVTDRHNGHVIEYVEINEFTRKKYWGAKYGVGHRGQHNNVIRYGWGQKSYKPHYTGFPLYREGKWAKKWTFSWRHGWRRKWYKRRGWFRCDTFVRYCYKKATGVKLGGNHTRLVRPLKVHKSLPYRR